MLETDERADGQHEPTREAFETFEGTVILGSIPNGTAPEPETDTSLTDVAHCVPPGGGLPPALSFTPSAGGTGPPKSGDVRYDAGKSILEIFNGSDWVELSPAPGPPGPMGPPADPTLPEDMQDVARAFAELEAEQRFVDLTSSHDAKNCTEQGCFICKELAAIKAETIESVKDKLIDRLYDEVIAVSAMVRSDVGPAAFAKLVRDRLVNLRKLTYQDLW